MPTDEYNEKQADDVLSGIIYLEDCDDPDEVANILGIRYRPYDPENIQPVPGHDYNTSLRVNQGLPHTNNNYIPNTNNKKRRTENQKREENEYKDFCYFFCFFILLIWLLSVIFN